MLDKSVPYYNLIMRRSHNLAIQPLSVPNGYSLRLFCHGDEREWAEIEASVGEFADVDAALDYFRRNYMPYPDQLAHRCIIVRDERYRAVGTVTAWWNDTRIDLPGATHPAQNGIRRDCSLHWLGVRPEAQGAGLGTALTLACLHRFADLHLPTEFSDQSASTSATVAHDVAASDIVASDIATSIVASQQEVAAPEVWLHTQTWSHRAIRIYLRLGFEFVQPPASFGGYANDYEKAMQVLSRIL